MGRLLLSRCYSLFLRWKMSHEEREGSRPEWCISSMTYSRNTPFWSGTLEIQDQVFKIGPFSLSFHVDPSSNTGKQRIFHTIKFYSLSLKYSNAHPYFCFQSALRSLTFHKHLERSVLNRNNCTGFKPWHKKFQDLSMSFQPGWPSGNLPASRTANLGSSPT